MTRVRRYRQALLLLGIATVAAAGAFGQNPIDVSDTREILITPVQRAESFGKSQKGDEALLIRDSSEIARLVALFHKNIQHKVHACGYNWRLTFFRNGSEPTEIYFNEKCEEFDRNTEAICELIQAKFRQTVAQPNAYLTNLGIDVSVTPEVARSDLSSRGFRVFSLRQIQRLPYVEIRASSTSRIPADRALWNAEKFRVVEQADRILVHDIARIRDKYKVVEIGDLQHGMSMFGGGEIMEQRRVKLYFEVGTSLGEIGKLLNGSRVEETVSPSHYSLQVLTPARLNESEISKLKRDFSFIRVVGPF